MYLFIPAFHGLLSHSLIQSKLTNRHQGKVEHVLVRIPPFNIRTTAYRHMSGLS